MADRIVYLLCIVIGSGIKVLCDDCDLKLSQIFRTPKDFSSVNFDHFEILERNNFDASSENPDPVVNNDLCKYPPVIPKSIANAQVMLRFGGDDIHGKNYLGTVGKVTSRTPTPEQICYYPDRLQHPHFNNYRPEMFPAPRPALGPMPPYPIPVPYYYPFHPPLPPFAFPSYYHLNSPYVHPEVPAPTHYSPVPVRNDVVDVNGTNKVAKDFDKDFEEFREGGLENKDRPKILRTRDLSKNDIADVPNSTSIETSQETSDDRELETLPSLFSRNGFVAENEINGKPIVTLPVAVAGNVQQVVDPSKHEIPSLGSTVLVTNDDDLAVVPLNPVQEEVEDKSPPPNLFNIIANQIGETITVPTPPIVKPIPSSPHDIPTSPAVESWLNNSLVPYHYNCKNGGHQKKLLVSYPVSENKGDIQPEVKPIGTCSCIAEKGYCGCGQCHRRADVPFGKRFPADIDSLHRMVDLEVSPYSNLKGVINSGYSNSIESEGTTVYERNGNELPKIYMNGLSMSSGSGYYRDPSKEVILREPTIVEVFKGSNSIIPEFIQSKDMKPHVYEVVPKYDIIPKEIPSLNIPDLLSTNKFVCTCQALQPSHHKSIERPSFFCPVHGPFIHQSDRPSRTVIMNMPYEKCPYCGNTGPFLEYVSDARDIP